jgi:enamine deaminase RidA (YjgF/YER057c/UK114 family)
MLRCITLRLALPVVLTASLLSAAVLAQSQDTQSVADAARRAREQKKPPAKPAKVITDEDIKPAAPSNPATPGSPVSPDASAATAAPASSTSSAAAAVSAPARSPSPAPDAKDQKDSKEVTELKAQIKQALADLNLVLREQSLEQDNYYSNTDYVHDTAGKAKLDGLKQQAGDRQQELDRLKARLAELLTGLDTSSTSPPKP